jgi:hypothetical protein
MKPIPQLNLGFSDSTNYKHRKNREMFNKFFVRLPSLDRLLDPDRYFLIGDKGTGKTAFAIFLSNNEYKNTKGSLVAINETEYQSFIALKMTNNLTLSGYDLIWRVILLLLISEMVSESDYDANIIRRFSVFLKLKAAVSRYYNGAFSPEIISALRIVESSDVSSKALLHGSGVESQQSQEVSSEEHRFQSNLRLIARLFVDALSKVRLTRNITLFIDGIDIRPHGILYADYLDCIRGLANAVWHLNHNVFSGFRDSSGRFKIVTLLRPDIFASLGLQNQNAKIQDNSVYLDWLTTYPLHRNSELFEVSDRLLSVQQESPCQHGEAWDFYFPFANPDSEPCFVSFLRFSFFRPRDINKMMRLLQEQFIRSRRKFDEVFTLTDFNNTEFRRDYSNYLLGEVRDYLQFYYTDDDIAMFLKFFAYLDGRSTFTLKDFTAAFTRYEKANIQSGHVRPAFFETNTSLLQFLYELGIICYKDYTTNGSHYHLCFRERTYANMHPKVSFDADDYMIHYGLRKALNTGARRGNNS